ncbi:MAG: divalent metal cation transporter [Acidobacteriota bacterium]
MRRVVPVLLGAVLAAAFLGPGTITTAARSGASHGLALLWTLVFATVACLILQETAARLAIISGHDLGTALRRRFRGQLPARCAAGAVILGCAAYEAGNILGGVAGAELVTSLDRRLLVAITAGAAGLLLWFGTTRGVSTVLSVFVAVMGVGFLLTATLLRPPVGELAPGLVLPTVPAGAGLLVLGLVGTTVVPYNLFLGSGIAGGQTVGELRYGLALAIGLGGVISMGVLVVGSAVVGEFSFEAVATVLADRLGAWAAPLFGVGLFAAGFTSAVTAPWAAAIAARSCFGDPDDSAWGHRGRHFRGVWFGVLFFGTFAGFLGVRPIPVILLAQAANGILLPIVAVFLFVAANDRRQLGDEGMNGPVLNLLTALVVAITVALGFRGLLNAGAGVLGRPVPGPGQLLVATAIVLVAVAWPTWRWIRQGRRKLIDPATASRPPR